MIQTKLFKKKCSKANLKSNRSTTEERVHWELILFSTDYVGSSTNQLIPFFKVEKSNPPKKQTKKKQKTKQNNPTDS